MSRLAAWPRAHTRAPWHLGIPAANCPTKECASTEAVGKMACKEKVAMIDQAPLQAKFGAITKLNVFYAESNE